MATAAVKGTVVNVGIRLSEHARQRPDQPAVVEPNGRDRHGNYRYNQISFADLEADSNRLASALVGMGVRRGTRLALLVRPGIDFVSLVFALFKCSAVTILIDPGMGRRNLLRCLAEAKPEGFVAIPRVHAIRVLLRRRFPDSRFHVTVGRRLFWGGETLAQLRAAGGASDYDVTTLADDPAAIIFTTGSTGVPKGVLYCHQNFDHQVTQIQQHYGIEPGGVDLAGFPLFGLFNSGMGVTTVVPDMDATRPADVDPEKIIAALEDWKVTQSFGSPALWNRVATYCEQHGVSLPATLKAVYSAGAPVPGHVLRRLKQALPEDSEIHTPYGATEALPVASISATEVLDETQARTDAGAGVCVGQRYSEIQWRVIRIINGPLRSLADATPLPDGEIGELIVSGPVVTRRYVTQPQANVLAKIADGSNFWHRMGDVGYLDAEGRFWFCGRMSHRVQAANRTMYTIPCEAVFNTHDAVYRTALVGIGAPGQQRPVLVVEPLSGLFPKRASQRDTLLDELREIGQRYAHTRPIKDFLLRAALPVDIRHNSKIFREKLSEWAARRLRTAG